jgi:hypothetical protein
MMEKAIELGVPKDNWWIDAEVQLKTIISHREAELISGAFLIPLGILLLRGNNRGDFQAVSNLQEGFIIRVF